MESGIVERFDWGLGDGGRAGGRRNGRGLEGDMGGERLVRDLGGRMPEKGELMRRLLIRLLLTFYVGISHWQRPLVKGARQGKARATR